MMPKFIVDADWTVYGSVTIEAKTEKEAKKKADDLPLSNFNAEYSDGSFEIRSVVELDKSGKPKKEG